MPAEETHEIGRRGVIETQALLWRILGKSLRLPFNAYDHPEKLSFSVGSQFGIDPFNFDLRGNLERRDNRLAGGLEAKDVFVEVKSYESAADLLAKYRDFLKRAAVVTTISEYKQAWFFYVSSVPFGSSFGIELCDGTFLRACAEEWDAALRSHASGLESRVAVIVATQSFRRVLARWRYDD